MVNKTSLIEIESFRFSILNIFNSDKIKNYGMPILDEAKKIFQDLLGEEVAKQLNGFSDPKKYPKDFLDDCVYFLSKFIGEEAAKKKFELLYKKYTKT